jgi:hypothetical protein
LNRITRLVARDLPPSFGKSSFDLKVPKLDPSMVERLKNVKGGEKSKGEAKEEALVASAGNDPFLVSASETALQLWGEAFHNITIQRRENVLRQTDPTLRLF